MKEITWRSCMRVGVTAALVMLVCMHASTLLALAVRLAQCAAPLMWGAGAAYVVNILLCALERRLLTGSPWQRPVCLALAVLLIAALAVLLACTLLPELLRCTQLLISALPEALGALLGYLETEWQLSAWLTAAQVDWHGAVQRILALVMSGVDDAVGFAAAAAAALSSTAAAAGASAMFAVYLLHGKEQLSRQVRRAASALLGSKASARAFHVLAVVDGAFRRYITGQCSEALILGALCFAGMLLCRFDQPLSISVLAGFSALIPVAGPYLAAVAGAVILLMSRPEQTLLFLAFFFLLQQVEGSVIYPRVVGASLGLPGVWVLAAVTLGGGLLGIPGMLLGVPLSAAAYCLVREQVQSSVPH